MTHGKCYTIHGNKKASEIKGAYHCNSCNTITLLLIEIITIVIGVCVLGKF